MARSFNGGTDQIVIPSAVVLPLNSPVTVTFWNYVSSANSVEVFTIGSLGSPDRCQVNCPWSDGNVYFDYGSTTTGSGRVSTAYGSGNLGKWTHVGLVSAGVGGSFQGIYLNGSLAASVGTSSGPTVSLPGGYIGRGSGALFDIGSVAHFAVWSAALSAGQIADLAAGGTPTIVQSANLLCYYPLWGLSTTEADLSGGANNGTVTGTTVVADPPIGGYAPYRSNIAYATPSIVTATFPPQVISQYNSFF